MSIGPGKTRGHQTSGSPILGSAKEMKKLLEVNDHGTGPPGHTLVVVGTVYRGGTLPSGIANNDPNAPGGIGKILCRALLLAPVTDLKKKD